MLSFGNKKWIIEGPHDGKEPKLLRTVWRNKTVPLIYKKGKLTVAAEHVIFPLAREYDAIEYAYDRIGNSPDIISIGAGRIDPETKKAIRQRQIWRRLREDEMDAAGIIWTGLSI